MELNTKTYETDSRIEIDKHLKQKKWILNKNDKKRNVFTEGPKFEFERKKLKGKRPDYILYDDDEIIAIIEAKKNHQSLDDALKQVLNYAKMLNLKCPIFVSDGFTYVSYHIKFKEKLKKNSIELNEIPELKNLKIFKKNHNWETLDKKYIKDRNELIKLFSYTNKLLRKDGIKNGEARFNEFSNILFIKIFSEIEYKKEKKDREIKNDKFLWNYIFERNESELSSLEYINKQVIPEFSKIYGKNIFKESKIKNKKVLKEIMEKLNELSLIDLNSDIKGDAFEFFLRDYNSNYSDLGQYFTPRNIINLMIKILKPTLINKKTNKNNTIYDHFCGTGGMLIAAFKFIKNNEIMNPEKLELLRKKTLYGSEISDSATISKKNMIFYGDGHTNVVQQDSLFNKVEKKYDFVITNIPFSQKTDYAKLYNLNGKGADPVCIAHCIYSLKKGGKGAIIVPEGFLYSIKNDSKSKNRLNILNKITFDLIVPLPRGIFRPYAKDVKTYIIFFTNKKPKKNYSINFFEIFNVGYELNTSKKEIHGINDIDKLLFMNKKNNENNQFTKIPIEKIKSNNNILALSYYDEINKNNNQLSFEDIFKFYNKKNTNLDYKLKDIISIDKLGLCIKASDKFEYSNSSEDLSNYKILNKNNFIFRPVADRRIVFNYNNLNQNVIASNLYLTFKNISKIPDSVIFYSLNKSNDLQKKLQRIGFGTARPSINKDLLKKLIIDIPKKEKWQNIENWFKKHTKEVSNIRKWNENWKK